MSLSIYIVGGKPIKTTGTGIFIRENGRTRELSLNEVREKWPNSNPSIQQSITTELFEINITHNLATMAEKAGLYEPMWRPDENGYVYAKDVLPALKNGYRQLKKNANYFKQFNPENGWGDYDGLLQTVELYAAACAKYPDGKLEVSR